MRRREFITLVGSTAFAWPLTARAQQSAMPVVGMLNSGSRDAYETRGATFLTNALEAKRLGLLHELLPQAGVIGVLLNPKNASAETVKGDLNEAARGLGIALRIVQAGSEREFDSAFASFDQEGVRALLVASDSVFSGNAKSLVTLAERHTLPTIYFVREFPAIGGLMSYGTSFDDAYRQAGRYVGAFSRARARPICPSCSRPSSNLSSTSRPPRRRAPARRLRPLGRPAALTADQTKAARPPPA